MPRRHIFLDWMFTLPDDILSSMAFQNALSKERIA
ncbi:hypothetical protein VT03_28845 [Planctomyces sp. SH-PL14]|nr:hypothetical protein VT03_28845 [Planctomyces sp. SH-PL14]